MSRSQYASVQALVGDSKSVLTKDEVERMKDIARPEAERVAAKVAAVKAAKAATQKKADERKQKMLELEAQRKLAVPPSELLRSRLRLAIETVSVDRFTGWNGEGWGPNNWGPHNDPQRLGPLVFQARMQGFFHWFFYRSRGSDEAAYAQARWRPAQVDPCVWNLQEGFADLCMREFCDGHTRAYSHLHHPHEHCELDV